jgi:hypothetical protein
MQITGIWACSRESSMSFSLGLVKGKNFFQFVVSNLCSDVQKLFSVIRDSSSDIMYKISFKKQVRENAKKMNKITQLPSSPAPFYKSTYTFLQKTVLEMGVIGKYLPLLCNSTRLSLSERQRE